MGESKHIAKKLIYDIYHKFQVKKIAANHPVPHVTLFGSFGCKSISSVMRCIREVCSEYSELEYQINGFDYFELKKKFIFITTSTRKNVLYLKIIPSEELKECRYRLAQKLLDITNTIDGDESSKDKFEFHTTLAMKDIHEKFEKIWEYLKNYKIKTYGVCYRITLLKESKIMYEFDLPTQKMLNRKQVLNRKQRR